MIKILIQKIFSMIDLKNKSVIICGSKPYDNKELDKTVDTYDIIIRHNFNISKYGTRLSDYQILNNHVFQSRLNMSKLISNYGKNYNLNILNDFHKFIKENPKKYINILSISISSIQKNISFTLGKRLRCGFYSIAYCLEKKIHPNIVGFSTNPKDYANHILNNLEVNDSYHDRNQEIKVLNELESKGLIKILDK